MPTISTKTELVEWLKEHDLLKRIPQDAVPDVKPARKSKWVDYEREPDWVFDDVYVSLDPLDKEAVGGRAQIGLDLTQQNNTVKVCFVRTCSGKRFFTRISKFGAVYLPKQKVDDCSSMKELADLVNSVWSLKIELEDPAFVCN